MAPGICRILNFFVSVWILQLPDCLTYSKFFLARRVVQTQGVCSVDDSWLCVEERTGGSCLNKSGDVDVRQKLGREGLGARCVQPKGIMKSIPSVCLPWEASCWKLWKWAPSEVPKPGWATESPGEIKKWGKERTGLHLPSHSGPEWSLAVTLMCCRLENCWTRGSLDSSSRVP